MSEKSDVKVPEEIRKGWEEARLCANLIREGKAKIMIATRKDGTTYRSRTDTRSQSKEVQHGFKRRNVL